MRVVVVGHVRGSRSQSHPPHCTFHPGRTPYAAAHDEALWDTLLRCLGGSPPDGLAYARDVAGLPAAMGGLGLCSASRVSPAAYWAEWADALTVIQTRRAGFAEARVAELSSTGPVRLACGRRRRPEHSCKQKVGLLFHLGRTCWRARAPSTTTRL